MIKYGLKPCNKALTILDILSTPTAVINTGEQIKHIIYSWNRRETSAETICLISFLTDLGSKEKSRIILLV